MAKMLYSRWTSFTGFILCTGLLIFAAYLQLHLGLLPCPLCVLQRILLVVIGFIFLVGALYCSPDRFGQRLHSGLLAFFSLAGIGIAGRHVWLTFLPPSEVPACSPTLDYMLQNLPLTQTLKIMFIGSGDCAKVTYRLMGLSIPEWTLIIFIIIFIFSLIRFVFAKSERAL